ncbi:MAG: 50S ribosomal protein L29 [Oscillospiraceae bacterium]|nr:50S ribosomal protein L29 [Oscillospiraceae bacterium]
MKATEVRGLSQNELNDRLVGLKKDLFFLRMQHATNQLDNPLRIAQVRKDIARVKTVIRQKELEELGGKA